jgi:hypothetical protein
LHHGANGCGLQPKGDNIEGYQPKGRADLPENIAARIRRAGGVISYVAIDESYAANKTNMAAISRTTKRRMTYSLFSRYTDDISPDVQLGDIENLPGTETPQ